MANYTSEVAKSHKKFEAALKRAKTRQSCLNAYWKHKKDHETLQIGRASCRERV